MFESDKLGAEIVCVTHHTAQLGIREDWLALFSLVSVRSTSYGIKHPSFKKFRYHFKYEHLGICLGGESCFTPSIRPSPIHVRGLSWRGSFMDQLPLRCLIFLQVIKESLFCFHAHSHSSFWGQCATIKDPQDYTGLSLSGQMNWKGGGGSSFYLCFCLFWSATSLHWTLKK